MGADMDSDVYRAALDAITESGDLAHARAVDLAEIMERLGHSEYHRRWLEIADAILEFQFQKAS
jgi:hypothetical protein